LHVLAQDLIGEPAVPATKERPIRRTRLTRKRRTQAGSSSAASRFWDVVGVVSAAIFIGIVIFSLKPMHNQSAGNGASPVATASAGPVKAQ
jgi:hypothetical protein